MFDIPDKVDGSTTLPAAEFNSLKNESENIIKVFFALGGDDFQIARSVSTHVATADFYNDGGVADVYTLSNAITNVQAVPTIQDGLRVRFFANATNTGAASGVTVKLPLITIKNIKQFNGDELAADSIVAGEMTELVYLLFQDFFVVSSSSDTRTITQDVTLTVAASGAQFTTLHDAYESLRNQYIADNAKVKIEIQGKISETLTTTFTHSEGKQISIVGAPETTVDIDAVNNVSGVAGDYSIEYTISASLLAAVIGDYIFIYDTIAGGPDALKFYNKKHEGLWEITALTATTVTVTNKFGFGAPDTPKTNDLAVPAGSGKITFLPAQITYTTDSFLFINGAELGELSNVVIVNNVVGAIAAFLAIGAQINVTNAFGDFFFGVVAENRRAIQMDRTEMFGLVIMAAISDVSENFLLLDSSIRNQDKILSNAGGGDRNFVAEGCNINVTELVVCGAAGVGLLSNTVLFLGGTAIIANIFVIANKAVGLRIIGGTFLSTVLAIIDDNAVGLEVWSSGNFTSITPGAIVRIEDNTRAGGINRVGVRVINSSTLMLGADEAGQHFDIAEITITGNTTNDLQVRMCGSAGLFASSGLIGKANANNVASIIHNVTITTPTASLGGVITLEP